MKKDVQPDKILMEPTPKLPYLMERTPFNEMYFEYYSGVKPQIFEEKFLIVYLDEEQKQWIDLEEWKLVRFKAGIKAN
jgi:hypothetical protein